MTFQMTLDDARKLDQYMGRRNGSMVMNVIRILVFAGIFCELSWFAWTSAQSHHGRIDWGSATTALIPLAILLFWVFSSRRMARQMGESPIFKFPQTVSISPRALQVETYDSTINNQWSGIQRIESDQINIYFVFAKDLALSVPKRAFLAPCEAEEFLASAMAYWKGLPVPAAADNGTAAWPPAPQRQPSAGRDNDDLVH